MLKTVAGWLGRVLRSVWRVVWPVVVRAGQWIAKRSRWVARRPLLWVPLALIAAVGLLVLLLGPIAWWATPAKHLQGKEKADARNATRQTLLAAVGGLVVLFGAVFAARTYYLSRRGQLTDRYTKAIGQLASSDKLTERLGGIYALEHLMIESERDHDTVVEVLAAFIRERAPIVAPASTAPDANRALPPATSQAGVKPPTDVQAALTVLGRRPLGRTERNPINLTGTDLRGAHLQRARLDNLVAEGAQLQGAHLLQVQLREAYLAGAQLQGAHLIEARLPGAYLFGARLQGARLDDAQLQGAFLLDAQMEEAYLHGAQMQRAHLFDAQLQGANLVDAQLQGANLHGAHLQGAHLAGAQLHGADLSEVQLQGANLATDELGEENPARGLTIGQLRQAEIDDTTQLSPELRRALDTDHTDAEAGLDSAS